MSVKKELHIVWELMQREMHENIRKPILVFALIIAPILTAVFFLTLTHEGVPTNLPIAVVDLDESNTSQALVRNLDAFKQTKVVAHYASVDEARKAMQRQEIYGFFYIPKNFAADAFSFRQPLLSLYTNDSFILAAGLVYSDMRTLGVLAAASAVKSSLEAHGMYKEQMEGLLQPIIVDIHGVHNPWSSYAVYLCNGFVPGVFMLLIFLTTVFTVAVEIKKGKSRQWLQQAGNSIHVALIGKLLPHTLINFLIVGSYNVVIYGFMGFPCHSGLGIMLLGALLLVLASQGMGLFMIGVMPSLRFGLSFASLWGIISLSIAGVSYPLESMHPMLHYLAQLFPLRHYLMFYIDQALNGIPLQYSSGSIFALMIFMALPYTVLYYLKKKLIECNYIP